MTRIIRSLCYWGLFFALLALGIMPFIYSDIAGNPVAIYNFILPILSLSLLMSLYVRGTFARYYCLVVTGILIIIGAGVACFIATPQGANELVFMIALLGLFWLDCAFNCGGKRYFEKGVTE